ncbi:MAG: hypothetical protein CM1200mP16_15150 [Nitrospina sp.]|nr:MAG: hypothetical protein CM1200mP16_15150 [Nitrospina sp.]
MGYANSVIAAILLVISTWIDGVDGEIARVKFMETDIGKKLDIYCDNIIHFWYLPQSVAEFILKQAKSFFYILVPWLGSVAYCLSSYSALSS